MYLRCTYSVNNNPTIFRIQIEKGHYPGETEFMTSGKTLKSREIILKEVFYKRNACNVKLTSMYLNYRWLVAEWSCKIVCHARDKLTLPLFSK